jgi:hypothetical protein
LFCGIMRIMEQPRLLDIVLIWMTELLKDFSVDIVALSDTVVVYEDSDKFVPLIQASNLGKYLKGDFVVILYPAGALGAGTTNIAVRLQDPVGLKRVEKAITEHLEKILNEIY